MSGSTAGVISKSKVDKKRAQPGDFERQVDQIRRDIKAVRDNLAAAEKALQSTTNAFSDSSDDEPKTKPETASSK